MKSSEGGGRALAFAPNIGNIRRAFAELNSREARVAFIDTWLKTWAAEFEHTWPVVYQALEWVEQDRLYEDPRATAPDEQYPNFQSYFEARLKKPFTLWIELEKTHRYVSKYAPELIEQTWSQAQTARAAHAQQTDAKDQANLRPAGRPETVYNNENDVHSLERPSGNTAAAFIRRLRKDRPDIHQRVLAGELSPHAGMVEAGFRKKVMRPKLTRLQKVQKFLQQMTKLERRELWNILKAEFR